jgi:crotonobetainyl-CoA:carnitine CoA-transferase CaiB-like acyl-CoA transferase
MSVETATTHNAASPPNDGPLARLRVLELGHFIAGPFCTRLMADLGADVIKVEAPGRGDPVRGWGEMQGGRSSIWWSVHGRNKRSITLNMKSARAKEVLLALVRECDVLVENYRPGQLERWGLDHDALQRARPGLVLVRISGYGQTGPYADRSAFGVIGEAIGGIRRLTAFPDGVTDLPPARTGVSLGDSVAALYGAFGALAAILDQRARQTPELRVVDVALTESVLSLMEGCLPEYGLLGKVREPTGSTLPTNAPSNAYCCKDGEWILIAANSTPLFEALATLMGRPDLARDPRFAENPDRVRHAQELDALIGAWTGGLTVADAFQRLNAVNIPATKIYSVADIANDRQFLERGMIREVADPAFGTVLHPAPLPMFSGGVGGGAIRWPGPEVGAHNAEVYGGLLGLSQTMMEQLAAEGVI